MDTAAEKSAQRKAGIAARRALSEADRAAANAALCRRIAQLRCFREAQTLLAYAAFGGEADLSALLAEAERLGKGYYDRYLPRCQNAVTLGVAFEVQRVERAAADPHDRQLDSYATEEKIYRGTDKFEL